MSLTGEETLEVRGVTSGKPSGETFQTTTQDIADLASTGGGVPDSFNIKDFGAVGDGSANDTAAIQAAFDAAAAVDSAVVYIPDGTYKITDTITVGGGDGSGDGTTFISIQGTSPVRSLLEYQGTSDKVALDISLNKYFKMSGVGLHNGSGSKGTTVGIRLDGPGSSGGTMTLSAIIELVIVDGFATGIFAGSTVTASSEIFYNTITLNNNTTGWQNQGLNTLDHQFYNLSLSGNTTGVIMDSGNVYVNGGSASGSTVADFSIQTGGYGATATFEIKNFRSEESNRFVTGFAGGHLSIWNNMVVSPANVDEVVLEIGPGGPCTIEGNMFDGYILFTNPGSSGSAKIACNRLKGENSLPFKVSQSGNSPGYLNRLRIIAFANQNTEGTSNNTYFNDAHGVWDNSYLTASQHVIWGELNTGWPKLNLGVNSLGQNPWVYGNNLRLPGKFASSGDLNVTFKRNETITTNGNGSQPDTRNLIVSSGHFTTADIGRKMAITQSGNTYYCRIISIVDATHIEVNYTPGGEASGAALSAVVGEDEPDGNYTVFVSSGAAETIYVDPTTTSTTGFTAHSDNASSTAQCVFLIVR